MRKEHLAAGLALGAGALLIAWAARRTKQTQQQQAEIRAGALRSAAFERAYVLTGGRVANGAPVMPVIVRDKDGAAVQVFEGGLDGTVYFIRPPGGDEVFGIRRGFRIIWEDRGGTDGAGYPMEEETLVEDKAANIGLPGSKAKFVVRQKFTKETFFYYEGKDKVTIKDTKTGRVIATWSTKPPSTPRKRHWWDDAWDFVKSKTGDVINYVGGAACTATGPAILVCKIGAGAAGGAAQAVVDGKKGKDVAIAAGKGACRSLPEGGNACVAAVDRAAKGGSVDQIIAAAAEGACDDVPLIPNVLKRECRNLIRKAL